MSRAIPHARSWPVPGLTAALVPFTLLLAALALAAAPARADFTPATLVSGAAQVQFDEANAPALSADGRYAVFQGSLASVPGIYRRDLQTGAVELIAGAFSELPAASEAEKALSARDAAAPSVSADGRYVAFTTTADLEPLSEGRGEPPADQGCPEVYVRDMEKKLGEPGAYTLVTASNGSEEGITFETKGYVACGGVTHGFPAAGAQAAPSVALSADGRHVAFTVLSESNLAGANTPPGQVAVRDLDAKTTALVTATPGGQPVSGGGAFPSTYSLTETPVKADSIGLGREYVPPRFGDQAAGSTAGISADASTVAWLGMNVLAQVPPAEAQREPQLTEQSSGKEAEPLWRRVADGPGAETRRLLAGAGLGFFFPNPVPPPNPVEAGSLVGTSAPVFVPPALSADGHTVAAVASAPPAAAQPGLAEIAGTGGVTQYDTDAYAIHVADDSASVPVVTPLTEITSYAAQPAAFEAVKDVAISSDGTRVAFDTARTQPYLPSLAFVSPPSAFTDKPETYEANLQRGTLQRVTSTFNGVEPNGEAGLLAFSGDGQTLDFASQASNLFYGDGLGTSWEVYAAHELPSSTEVTPQQIGAPPPPEAPGSEWQLSATATAAPDGSVLVDAEVPGAGRLGVRATAQLPAFTVRSAARTSRHPGARRRAHRARTAHRARGAKHARRGAASRGGGGIPALTVARAVKSSSGPSAARAPARRAHLRRPRREQRGAVRGAARDVHRARPQHARAGDPGHLPSHGARLARPPGGAHEGAAQDRREASRARDRAMRRALGLAGALAAAGVVVVLGLGGGPLGALGRALGGGGHAANALAAGAAQPPTTGDGFEPELGLPATEVVALGVSPGEAPGEVWAYGRIGAQPAGAGGQAYANQWALLERSDSSGWQVVPLPSAPGGEPLVPFGGNSKPLEYKAFAGQATTAGGVVLLSGQNVVVRDPGGSPQLAPTPAALGSGPNGVLAAGEALLPEHPGAVTLPYAAIEDPGHTGLLIAPFDDGGNPNGTPTTPPGVLHYNGQAWTREPLEGAGIAGSHFAALALACGGGPASGCWLLASFQTIVESGPVTTLLLFKRAPSSDPSGYTWREVQVNDHLLNEHARPPGVTVAALPQGAQMLTATTQGVWVDFRALETSGTGQNESDVSELVPGGPPTASALGPWCYPTGLGGCERSLGARLPSSYRSFAWPGAGEDPGTRIITGLSHRAMLELAGGGFGYQAGPGGDAGQAPGAAAFYPPRAGAPQEGWVADGAGVTNAVDGAGQAQVIHLTTHPEGDQLGAEAVPFRRPLYALAQAPGTAPGDPQAPAVAAGEQGQIGRYEPGLGWRPEALYDASGQAQKPTLRGVAWPEPRRIYAIGDNGAMWLWRAETGLWEPDPAKPLNFIGNLQAIAFSPSDPSLGYAVGRQGALLRYGKSWAQVPLPPELQQVNFTSIAFAGGEALATYRFVVPDPNRKGARVETGGLAVEDGSGWHVDSAASALLAQLLFENRVLSKVAGLPDGGAVAAGPGKVIERDSPSGGWRFSTQPLSEAQNVSALGAYREPGGPVRAVVSVDLDEQLDPEHAIPVETGSFAGDVPPPTGAGQPSAFLGPDLIPSSGYLLRETAGGWSDMEHEALPAPSSGGFPRDMPVRPDPVLALIVDPSGGTGLAVGGQTGDLEGKGVSAESHANNAHYQTAAALRFPAGAASPNGGAPAPVAAPASQTSFVVAGQAGCAQPCADFAAEGFGPDVWLQHALQTANQIAAGSAGRVRGFLYTGGRLPASSPGPFKSRGEELEQLEGFERDLARYGALLGSGGGLPVYAAASQDVAPRGVGGGPFARFLAPFLPGSGAGGAYYSFASGGVTVIVLDYSGGALGSEQEKWLREQLEAAAGHHVAAGQHVPPVPAIVMGSDSLGFTLPYQNASSARQEVNVAKDAAAVSAILTQPGASASAYFFDYPGANVQARLGVGAKSIPVFGTGTLGYVNLSNTRFEADSLGSSGLLLASVSTAEHSADNVFPVRAEVVPNISQLALDATDGTLLRRSQVALFEALARRPPAGAAIEAGGAAELSGPDPYDPIPFNCQGPNCGNAVPTEYTFTSSNPDIGDFVAHDPTSSNPRQVELGGSKLPFHDSHSGLFCAFNEGTTTVSITTGGLTYSQPVRVLGGSVEYPCGTVPLKNPPRAIAAGESTFSPPSLPPASSPPASPQLQSAPQISVPPAPVNTPAPLVRQPPAPNPPFLPPPQPLLSAAPAIIPPISPTPARPTPPSGTAQVFEPVPITQKEEEEESAEETARQFSAYRANEHTGPGPWILLLVVLAAGAGTTIVRGGRPGRRRHPAFARSTARGRAMR
jgi:hypothetical protein